MVEDEDSKIRKWLCICIISCILIAIIQAIAISELKNNLSLKKDSKVVSTMESNPSNALLKRERIIRSEIIEVKVETKKEVKKVKPIVKAEVIVKAIDIVVDVPKVVVTEDTDIDTETIKYNMENIPKVWKSRLKGTDKWDSLIIKVGKEKGIDPIFLKCVMTIESGGSPRAINRTNKNGTVDYGLMQVNTGWGKQFDYNKMLSNPEYAISCGADVILCKMSTAKRIGLKQNAFNIFWLYNGYSAQGKRYATKVSKLYNAFDKSAYSSIIQ